MDLGECLSGPPTDDPAFDRLLDDLDRNLEDWPDRMRVATLNNQNDLYDDLNWAWDRSLVDPGNARLLTLVRTLRTTPDEILEVGKGDAWARYCLDTVTRFEPLSLDDHGRFHAAMARLPNVNSLSLVWLVRRLGRWPTPSARRAWQGLFHNEAMNSLRHLQLDGVLLAAGLSAISTAAFAEKLRGLGLRDCGLKGNQLHHLTNWPDPADLRELDISQNDASASAIVGVLQSRLLTGVSELRLGGNEQDQRTAQVFLTSPALSSLRRLSIDGARLDRRWLTTAFASELLVSLTEMSVKNGSIGDATLQVLLTTTLIRQLVALDLAGNGVTSSGAEALVAGLDGLPQLQRIDLSGNKVRCRDAPRLIEAAAKRGVQLVI